MKHYNSADLQRDMEDDIDRPFNEREAFRFQEICDDVDENENYYYGRQYKERVRELMRIEFGLEYD